MPEKILLEDILIGLQKTLSRVSDQTGQFSTASKEKACSYLVGDVQFSMNVPVHPFKTESAEATGNADRLVYAEDSTFRITLSGTIKHDIRIVDTSATDAQNHG